MNSTSDAAEQVVKLTLEGVEVAARISGAAARQMAVLLYTILKDQNKTRGQTRMVSMLRNHQELKICHVKADNLKEFARNAKGYGVLYAVPPAQKRLKDGVVDVFVPVTAAPQAARLFERLHLADVDMETIKTEITQTQEKGRTVRVDDGVLMEQLLGDPIAQNSDAPVNPTQARAASESPSEPILPTSGDISKRMDSEPERGRNSVRAQLAKIKENRAELALTTPAPAQTLEHRAPKIKQKKAKVK